MRRRLAVVAAALILLTTGCSMDDDSEGMGDAPVATTSTGKRGGDDSAATCTNMPDGYGNLCTKCVEGAKPWRVIEGTKTSYNGSHFTIVQDPKACGGDWVPGPRSISAADGSGVEDDDS